MQQWCDLRVRVESCELVGWCDMGVGVESCGLVRWCDLGVGFESCGLVGWCDLGVGSRAVNWFGGRGALIQRTATQAKSDIGCESRGLVLSVGVPFRSALLEFYVGRSHQLALVVG